MVSIGTASLISLGFIVYYILLFVVDNVWKAGRATNTPNIKITKLITEYGVTIKTFQKNNDHYGFSWFKTIWINEKLFKTKNTLKFTFYHEYYHIIKHHKLWIILMRLPFSLLPLTLVVLPWWIFTPVFISLALLVNNISKGFERKANEYARKKIYDA